MEHLLGQTSLISITDTQIHMLMQQRQPAMESPLQKPGGIAELASEVQRLEQKSEQLVGR